MPMPTPLTDLLQKTLTALQAHGPNTAPVPFALSYEQNPETGSLEWAAYVDHRNPERHCDITVTADSLETCLTHLLHRIPREIR